MITDSLKIILWGNEIGRLSWDRQRGLAYFEFNRQWLSECSLDVFPIIAPIKSPAGKRPIWGERNTRIYQKLPPFLADSLPDSWGSQVFECWRIAQGIRAHDITPLDILSFIGKRGMGALEFMPATSGIRQDEQLNMQSLAELAQRIFAEREQVKITANDSLTMQTLMTVGTSAGGRQPKAIIAINSKNGVISSGQIDGQQDTEYCILKFGNAERCTAELEMAYHDMAIAAGIQMMPCRLIDIEGSQHFITQRFDRVGGRKLHMQTLAALQPEAESYEQLLAVCRKLRLNDSTADEIFRRMVFNILANNTDDHNKNFSFLMDEQGTWKLAPAYDMTFIFNSGGYQPETIHCLMIRGKLSGQTIDDAMAFAQDVGIRQPQRIIEQVAKALQQFRKFAQKYAVHEQWISIIEASISEHLSAWGLDDAATAWPSITIDGITYENVHIERAYKGNFHLLATVAGHTHKFIISKNKAEYAMIESCGTMNLSVAQLGELLQLFTQKK